MNKPEIGVANSPWGEYISRDYLNWTIEGTIKNIDSAPLPFVINTKRKRKLVVLGLRMAKRILEDAPYRKIESAKDE